MATTVKTIMDFVEEDVQELFSSSGSTSVLINYVNRIHQMILGQQRWDWMLSVSQTFMTVQGQVEYWIGATGSQATGQRDTALNITDIREVKQGGVLSRSGYIPLWRTEESPNYRGWQNDDGTYRQGLPREYRNDPGSSNVISIYPAPDQGSLYKIVPNAPVMTTSVSGALLDRTYYVRLTFVDSAGNESASSTPASRVFVPASSVLVVAPPQTFIATSATGVSYSTYNVYASETENSETKQGLKTFLKTPLDQTPQL